MMIPTKKYLANRLLVIAALLLVTISCEDLVRDPLVDKESGENITVLLLDRNFIKTKLLIWLVDAETNEPMEDVMLDIEFFGEEASNLITFGGEKPDVFSTDLGFFEVGYDPNFTVSSANPLEVTVIAHGEGYISAPLFLSYTNEGTKDVILRMNKLIPGKSFKIDPYNEPYDIFYNDVLNSEELRYIADISEQPTGTSYDYINLYVALSAGNLLCDNLYDEIAYEDYGVYYRSVGRDLNVIPPDEPVRTAQLIPSDFVFSSVLNSGNAECEVGLTVKIDRSDGKPGTGSFDYLLTFSNGNTQTGRITCSFPAEIVIEPIYYPVADPTVEIQLFGDVQYDISAPVSLGTPCGSTAEFTATPLNDLYTYKFITQYVCPDSPVGLALSITGQFMQTGSTDPWSTFEFVEGICELQLVEGVEYDFRVAIDDEYHTYSLPTDPAQLETFILEHQGDDYQVQELEITELENKTEVFAILEVSDNVCDKIGGNPRR